MGIYIWKYLDCNLEPRFTFCIYNCGVELKWNSCAGTLTAKRVAQLVMLYMRERMYTTVYAVRSFNFPKFVRTYGTCMHHDKSSLLHTCIVSPLINFLLGYVTLIHYDFVSQELHMLLVQMAAPAGSEFPVDVWNSCPALESLALCGVLWTAPLVLEWSIPRGTCTSSLHRPSM